jgi:hypothetical protein
MSDTLGLRRNERESLTGSLDWYRAVVEHKLQGLSLDEATKIMTPSGLCPLGVVKHLGWVERGWFRDVFSGEDVESVDAPDDNTREFEIDPDDTVSSVVAFYRGEADESRRIVKRSSSLDALSAKTSLFGEQVSLRWILVHMLEETARHAGHLDLMRERIDGRTGD